MADIHPKQPLWSTRALVVLGVLFGSIALGVTYGFHSYHEPFITPRVFQKPKYDGVVWVHIRGANIAIPNKTHEEWEVRKAVFTYMMRTPRPEPIYLDVIEIKLSPPTYLMGTKDKRGFLLPDPPSPPQVKTIYIPDDVLVALRKQCQNVKRMDADDIVDGAYQHIISGILWTSPTEAEVAGDSGTYFAEKIDGTWQITYFPQGFIACGG